MFVEEQGVPEAEEWDGQDDASRHFIAEDGTGAAVGTARLMPSGQIGRMAVLKPLRGMGIGARLLAAAVDAARQDGYERIFLHAQTQAAGFYERAGFRPAGETFMEAGIEHRPMELGPDS
ncbi:MAG: GNAT family N-acetyltransferase [Gammaproteobacteria bacterium]|nr:GNAT family N-acetyltransferase [Gammaproteobacteria bacterium]